MIVYNFLINILIPLNFCHTIAQGGADFICGGPPCQGISGFNRFRNKDDPLADPKNHQLVVFMDIVDYLKPRYVLMENVVDILKFAGGLLGRYALGRLVSMNYQARLGIMAAGSYGLPQFRLRAFLWGAQPHEACIVLLYCLNIEVYISLLTFCYYISEFAYVSIANSWSCCKGWNTNWIWGTLEFNLNVFKLPHGIIVNSRRISFILVSGYCCRIWKKRSSSTRKGSLPWRCNIRSPRSMSFVETGHTSVIYSLW